MNTNRRESAHASAPTDDVFDDLERKKEQTKISLLKPCNDEQNIKFSLTQMAYRNQTLNIESSSLIESPVVSAVLISHGLLENGLHLFENSGVKIKTETKFSDESKIHQNQHRESSYKCQWLDCEQLCIDRDKLAEHVNWNHIQQGSDAEYHCQWIGCKRQGKGFNARYKMLMHMRCHTNEKPHVCACGKCFARLENLKIHMRCHTGEKPYVCHVEGCGKAYTNSSDRFKHTRTHFVEKPYVCKVEGCSKRYTDPSSLRKHRKTCGHYQNNTEQNIHFETRKLESYSDKNSSEIKVDKSCTFLTGHQGKVAVKPKVTKPNVLRPKSERSGVKWKHPFSEYSFYFETCHKLDNGNFRYSNTSDKMTAVYSFSPSEVLPLDLSTTNSENVNSSDTESYLQSP